MDWKYMNLSALNDKENTQLNYTFSKWLFVVQIHRAHGKYFKI